MYAHYVGTTKVKYVIISETNRPIGEKIVVKGKREANAVAKAYNAKPWNF